MDEYITKRQAIQAYCKYFCCPGAFCPDDTYCCEPMEAFGTIPTADVRPVMRGVRAPHYETWLNSDGNPIATHRIGYECPFCGDTGVKNFCPNCGADLRGQPQGAAEKENQR